MHLRPDISERRGQDKAYLMGRQHELLREIPRIHLKREEIARNVGLILIIGTLAAIAGIIFVLIRNEQRRSAEHILAHGTSLTDLISQVAGQYIVEGRVDALQGLMQTVKKRSVAYGMIVDTDNRIVAHTDERQQGQRFDPQEAGNAHPALGLTTTVHKNPTNGQTIWHFSKPINTAVKRMGTLHLEIIAPSPSVISWRLVENFSIIALIIFLLVPVVYYVLQALLRPMQKLSAKLEEIATSKQFQPLDVSHRGETGELVRNWNQAIVQLKEMYEAVEAANFELELTVNVISYEKKRLAMILDRLSDAILITDSSGKIIFANKITERFLNVGLDEVIGKSPKECFSHEGVLAFLTENDAISHNITSRSIEVSLSESKSDTAIITLSSIINDEESFIGLFFLIRDITHNKNVEQSRSEFISAVSHELKNPLATIKSYIELLTNKLVDDNETKYEFYNTIDNETDRMSKLIDNLLNMSKIEAGSLQIKPSRVVMKQLLTDSSRAVESQAMAKGITFDLDVPEKLSALEVDKDLLGMVIMNLLSNALKYTPEGGEVALLAEETEEEMLIHVRDTGIGIAEADLGHIFERFYRGYNGEKTAGGSGLGLALAQQITQLHGGSIKVASQMDQGSQFTIVLPKDQLGLQTISVGGPSRENSAY